MKIQTSILILLSIGIALFYLFIPLHTQDGPNHNKGALMIARLDNSPVESAHYRANLGFFKTNSLYYLAYQPFAKKIQIQTYEKIYYISSLVFFLAAYFYFLKIWASQRLALWYIALPLTFHPFFIMGMYNFLGSIGFIFAALAMLKQLHTKASYVLLILFAGLHYLAFLAHPFSSLILITAASILCFNEKFKMNRHFLITLALICSFFGVGFLLPFFQVAGAGDKPPFFAPPLPSLLLGFFSANFVAYKNWDRLYQLPYFMSIVAAYAYSLRQGVKKNHLYSLAFLAAYLLLPESGATGGHMNQRFCIFILLFLPVVLATSIKWQRALSALALATFVLQSSGVGAGMMALDKEITQAKQVLTALPAQSRLYNINFDVSGPANYPALFHVWAQHPDDRVVLSPNLFAYSELMPIVRRYPSSLKYFPATSEIFAEWAKHDHECYQHDVIETKDCAALKGRAYERLLARAKYYDYWLVHAPDLDFSSLLGNVSGLKQVISLGSYSLWRYEQALPFASF